MKSPVQAATTAYTDKMTSPVQAGTTAYTDGLGRRVADDDVEKWFTYGVKPVGKEKEAGMCSKKTTLYILAIAIFLVTLGLVIIIPAAVGGAKKG